MTLRRLLPMCVAAACASSAPRPAVSPPRASAVERATPEPAPSLASPPLSADGSTFEGPRWRLEETDLCMWEFSRTASTTPEHLMLCERQPTIPPYVTAAFVDSDVNGARLAIQPDTEPPRTVTVITGGNDPCVTTTTGRAFVNGTSLYDGPDGVTVEDPNGMFEGFTLGPAPCGEPETSAFVVAAGSFPHARMVAPVVDRETTNLGVARGLLRPFGLRPRARTRRAALSHVAGDPTWQFVTLEEVVEEDGDEAESFVYVGVVHGRTSHLFEWVIGEPLSFELGARRFLEVRYGGSASSSSETVVYELVGETLVPRLFGCERFLESYMAPGCGTLRRASAIELVPNGVARAWRAIERRDNGG